MISSRSVVLSLVLLSACLPKHEALGNAAYRAGDVATAAAEYDLAMGDTPMMDFEYERVRKKRKRLMEGEWSPKVDALLATAPTPITLAYVEELFVLRKNAFGAGIPEELAARIDVEMRRVVTPAELRTADVAEVPARLVALVALFDLALRIGAPQESVDAILTAYAESLAVGFPAPGPTEGLDRLTQLLDLREQMRTRRFPSPIDAALDAELQRVADVSFVPATAETATARFDATLTLRTRARALSAPAAAIALADRAHQDALTHVLARADAESAAHRYLPLYDALTPFVVRVEPGHPLLARLAGVATEGAAWHAAEAAALPPGYRKLLHESLAGTLAGKRAPAEAARKALEPSFTTSLTLQAQLSVDPSCAGMGELVTGALGKGARAMPMPLALTGCVGREGDSVSYRDHSYTAEEIYYVQENVQVGTRTERVITGYHDEQCSKPSSLDGYVWTGVCSVPDYENKTFPVYELQDVEKRRDVTRTVQYAVTTRTVQVEVRGVATLTWDDGTALNVPFDQRRSVAAEGWSYDVPGRTPADASSRFTQTIASSHSVAAFRREAGSAVARDIGTDMAAAVRAHRARLARAEGQRALTAGDAAGAGEAFVRSVLHDGKADAEAAAWFLADAGLAATQVETVLSAGGATRALPAGTPLPVASAYTPAAIAVGAGAAMRKDMVVDGITTETYQKGIVPPNEFVDFHVGIVPTEIQTGKPGARMGAAVGFDMHYNFLEMALKLRYGLVVHDQFGLRFTMGMIPPKLKEEYSNGEDEGPLAVTVDPSYALYLGLRLPYFGVFAGGSAGYLHAAGGDTVAFGYHVEPSVRLTVRAFRTKQLILEGSGFVSVPG
ncbi:MAG: hypothetical protein Q7U06_01850, partial [Pseudomonadota bacterium]|nr:hypothetical protein [Pseudomonadota bacterium]